MTVPDHDAAPDPGDDRTDGPATGSARGGLSLTPFRGRRYQDGARLARLLSPPYDVVDDAERAALLQADPDNVIAVVLPRTDDGSDPYAAAAERLREWTADRDGPVLALDDTPTLYVYDMQRDDRTTRGVIGALELRDPADGVVLPHEDVMAGPVADRLALMDATDADLEAIYLVYPGGGATSALVASVDADDSPHPLVADATTPDGVRHRLWAVTDPDVHAEVARDLARHRAVIADGHHRYATYRELQRRRRADHGPGPWDRGLTLLVDTSVYGAQVEAIHRVLRGMPLAEAVARLRDASGLTVTPVDDPRAAWAALARRPAGAPTAVVLADRSGTVVVDGLRAPGDGPDADLDVVAVHRDLVTARLRLVDDVDHVGYAHDIDDALTAAEDSGGTAVLLRPTPVDAVMAVAQAGGRMPRKSTLFVPKPASGLVLRRFADQHDDEG